MLTGTETSPKEIVAVAIERAGMAESGMEGSGRTAGTVEDLANHHKYFLRGKLGYRMLTFDDDRRKSQSTHEVSGVGDLV